jgi:ABC-type polysaccharide/polyol phosphate transport system ATPase subunit
MSEAVIRAVDLRKVYRLYTKPSYRFRDMFGLLGRKPGAYTEHAALDGISLEIARGEKVAIIGRNGAGKSTFLKLVTNVIQPTSGVLEVKGHVHALLQIGTGFHPDFTGRENVHAYLAQLGITGADAARKCEEAIEFAELEEYIDQPVKTYSTGMGVRLMFATSTAISPELLVLDEVLGVGDAYFSQKSFERMKELCERSGTTLLLVTHDIYSAVRLCERVIWIDRGRVLMDGRGGGVLIAYEDSIRQQEEQRLRLKKARRLRELSAESSLSNANFAILEIKSRSGGPQPGPVYFHSVDLLADGEVLARWPLGTGCDFDERAGSHLLKEGTNWGGATEWQGRASRPLNNYGSPFHKAAGAFALAANLPPSAMDRLSCRVTYAAPQSCDLTLQLRLASSEIELTGIVSGTDAWSVHEAVVSGIHQETINVSGVHGSGAIAVTAARFVGAAGVEADILRHGQPATLEIDYLLRDPRLRERAQVVIALHRDGVHDVSRFISRELLFNVSERREGTLTLTIPSLTLTDGTYSVTILIAKEGYYDSNPTLFYTVNPDVYCCISRMFDISVAGSGLIGSGTSHVLAGLWAMK